MTMLNYMSVVSSVVEELMWWKGHVIGVEFLYRAAIDNHCGDLWVIPIRRNWVSH